MTLAAIVSLVGLALDVTGAVILVRGLLVRDMTVFRASRQVMEREGGIPAKWYLLIPLRIAFRCGLMT